MRSRIIKIGVIGTGGMGGRHVSNITNEVASAHVVALMAFLQKYLIVFIFLGMCVFLAISPPNNSFLKPHNLINFFRQISVIGLLAVGVMLCIIPLGIDLSLGSVLGFSAVVTASLV